jgi:cysteine desulfurase
MRDCLAISTGSACTSGVETPSHVLQAIGLSETAIEGSLRIGLGKFYP